MESKLLVQNFVKRRMYDKCPEHTVQFRFLKVMYVGVKIVPLYLNINKYMNVFCLHKNLRIY